MDESLHVLETPNAHTAHCTSARRAYFEQRLEKATGEEAERLGL